MLKVNKGWTDVGRVTGVAKTRRPIEVGHRQLSGAGKPVEIKPGVQLVAARQPGVDRGKIQSEVTELQAQLRGIADSASFSGENWLSVDSGAATYNATKTIVSSFSRTGGAVSIGTISIDVGGTKLFDSNDQSGILDTASTTTNGGVSYSVAGSTDGLDISTLTDSIILLRYAEVDSEVKRGITVLKMRGSAHDKRIPDPAWRGLDADGHEYVVALRHRAFCCGSRYQDLPRFV